MSDQIALFIEDAPHADLPRESEFGRWMTETRIAAGLRQSDVAARLGVNGGRVAEWESGQKEPSEPMRHQIMAVLGARTCRRCRGTGCEP